MSIRDELISKGYKYETYKRIDHGTSIRTDFYIKGSVAVTILRIGRGREILSLYKDWGAVRPNTGHCVYYDISRDNLHRVLNGKKPVYKVKVPKAIQDKIDKELPF